MHREPRLQFQLAMGNRNGLIRGTLWLLLAYAFVPVIGNAQEYEVVPKQTAVRGHFWIGEGIADVRSSNNSSLGNKFRLGGELHLGSDYQFLFGWTFLDLISSGETSGAVGDISRSGSDFDFGYFIIPDRLWLKYSFYLGTVSGSSVIGNVNNYGHGVSVGSRIYSKENFNIALELEYQHLRHETASTFNFANNTSGVASFPQANVWSVNLRLGLDIGGRYS